MGCGASSTAKGQKEPELLPVLEAEPAAAYVPALQREQTRVGPESAPEEDGLGAHHLVSSTGTALALTPEARRNILQHRSAAELSVENTIVTRNTAPLSKKDVRELQQIERKLAVADLLRFRAAAWGEMMHTDGMLCTESRSWSQRLSLWIGGVAKTPTRGSDTASKTVEENGSSMLAAGQLRRVFIRAKKARLELLAAETVCLRAAPRGRS